MNQLQGKEHAMLAKKQIGFCEIDWSNVLRRNSHEVILGLVVDIRLRHGRCQKDCFLFLHHEELTDEPAWLQGSICGEQIKLKDVYALDEPMRKLFLQNKIPDFVVVNECFTIWRSINQGLHP